MSVIAIHAETARYRVPDPPPELVESFAVIRGSAVEALAEMRRLLALLRSADGAADTAPQPGLADLDGVVDKARASGLVIHTRVAGPARPLPPGVDLSAYRIGQEAISNVLRHAPGASVWLDVEYTPDAVRLRVRNGRPAGSIRPEGERTSGQGLLGMRERALMLGGTLATGPTEEGGFLVEAVLPIAPPPTAVGSPS
jgi:signal transduction histidine kinase